jgi:transposase
MIVIGTDTHKRTHTCGAVFAGTGQRAGELTAAARKGGFAELLDWGRELDAERIWALEDCRHVSGSFERFLIASGERVAEQGVRVRVSRELVRAIRDRTRRATELEREIGAMVRTQAPQLLELPGCGTLTAAKLIAETAGVARFASDAKLARLAGIAPIPASSGNRTRLRLDRGGNRQLNAALYRIAITQARYHPEARAYLERKKAEGKSRREAIRCLKRLLARVVFNTLKASPALT